MRSSAVLAIVVALWVAVASAAERDDEDTPHAKMLKDKAVCLDCHTKVPKPDEHAPNYFLVNAPSDTCLGCHSETEHPGVREHVGKDARPLPGDEKGAIACFTCHDPHPEGVIPGRRVYSTEPRATLPMRSVRLRFPAAHGEGCLTCHDGIRHDSQSWRERLLRDKFLRVYSY